MKTKIVHYVLAVVLIALFNSCRTTDPLVYATYESRAVAPDGAGRFVVRAQGKGTTKSMAIENAKSQAVRDVIFTDVHVAYGNHKPLMRLINDPSTEQKRPAFFNSFFSKDGEYNHFISSTKKEKESYSKKTNHTVILNVIVDREALRNRLMQEGLIK